MARQLNGNPARGACDLCGRGDPRNLFQIEGLQFMECRKCGVVYTYPSPAEDQLASVYHDGYILGLPGGEALDKQPEWIINPISWEATRVRCATEGTTAGRVLEIGCATGRFLALLKQRGWEVWGVEFNANAAAVASKLLKANVFAGDFMKANLPDQYFDVVTLFHVIEHTLHPRDNVQKMHDILKKGGRLVLETPDFGSRNARKLGLKWPHIKPGEHLYYFSERSLRNLLEGSGFRVEKVRRCGGLGVLSKQQKSAAAGIAKATTFNLRRWLAPTPWLRDVARRAYWDLLRQNDHILVVASRRT
jgi:SAM-dependent methyltransferase